jgi:desulfoferrodoxin-like iron-binding protein
MLKRILFVLLAVAFIGTTTSCTKAEKEDTHETDQVEAVEPAVDVELEEAIYTAENPGPWAGKEKGHMPDIVFEQTESGFQVTVSVAHEMAPEKPHYIEWIKLMDAEGNILGETKFQHEDKKAEAIFSLSASQAKLVALAKCNLHGLWQAEKGLQ